MAAAPKRRTDHVQRSLHAHAVIVSGHFAIGAAGAISTTASEANGLDPGEKVTGVSLVKTATKTGRYTGTFSMPFKAVPDCLGATFQGDTDSAFPTTTGFLVAVRNVSKTGFDLQCSRLDTNADAEPASGSVIHFGFNGRL